MFLPITTIGRVKNLDQAMEIANSVNYGLTAGFYGSLAETEWFFDKIEAGVTYANRPQGATTGAWPGFQPFGGWKGSGASGKNGGGWITSSPYARVIHTDQTWLTEAEYNASSARPHPRRSGRGGRQPARRAAVADRLAPSP
jgi:acyl-CoA reductase-like NAD-dependent aldehyde dehydrogenase